jgi:hypothetical protein
MKNSTLTIHNFNGDSIPYCEAQGLAKVFQAYADYCVNESIMDGGIGFNENSGYVYLALDNDNFVTICSMLGNDVVYLITNFDNGEELFFDTYEEAVNFDYSNDENI